MESKQCRYCNEIKDISYFHKGSGYKDGYQNQCRDCKRIRRNIYKTKASKYRTTPEIIKDLLDTQTSCRICGTSSRRLVIDHCHRTGKIRGILCHMCNAAIGLLNDDPDLIQKAKDYLSEL